MQPLAKTMALFVVSLLCVPCAAISGVGITQLTFVADLNATALPFPYAHAALPSRCQPPMPASQNRMQATGWVDASQH